MIKLPFGYLPGHWGLKGKTREIAKAEYELVGYELKKRLLEIEYADQSDETFQKKLLDLDLEYKNITKAQYNRKLLSFIKDATQAKLAELELDHNDGKISQTEYEKQIATAKGEPWVTVINMNFGGKTSLEGSFELDWNDHFVAKLKQEGYSGPTPDSIVNQWFMEVCRNIAMEEFEGIGNFAADSEANIMAVKNWSNDTISTQGRRSYK